MTDGVHGPVLGPVEMLVINVVLITISFFLLCRPTHSAKREILVLTSITAAAAASSTAPPPPTVAPPALPAGRERPQDELPASLSLSSALGGAGVGPGPGPVDKSEGLAWAGPVEKSEGLGRPRARANLSLFGLACATLR